MSNFMYIAKQPIYGKDKHVFGYELFYRSAEDAFFMPEDKRVATATVLSNALNQTGLSSLVGSSMTFVNIDSKILLTDILYNLPKERFIFELNEDIQINKKEYECIKELHREGYVFALDNVSCDETYLQNFSRTLPYVDYLKFDTTVTDYELLEGHLSEYAGKKLIAHKIESKWVYDTYQNLGFDYYQGFYLSEPELIKKNRLDPHHMGVNRLFNLLQSSNSMQEICDEFEQHNEIILQLLQFINSGGFHYNTPAHSICDILTAVGKKQLSHWLMLIVYAKSGHSDNTDINPTSIVVQTRIDLMLGILKRMGEENKETIARARFIALLSLLETVFEVPLAYVLRELGVEDIIKDALLANTGELGKLYALTLSLENSHQETAEKLLCAFGLEAEDVWHILEEHCGHPAPIIH